MPSPRSVFRERTYLITRRCVLRQFLLRPAPERNEFFLYCLAEAAGAFGVHVHGFCFMSNHYHLVVTDMRGELPEFMARLNRHLAGCVNADLGRRGEVFDGRGYNRVEIVDAESFLREMGYVLSNPVKDGLVSRAHLWPGLWSGPWRMEGKRFSARRPGCFFSGESMPERVELQLRAPAKRFWLEEAAGVEGVVGAVKEKLAALEEAHRKDVLAEQGGFLGTQAVLAQRPETLASSPEDEGRLRTPVACSDPVRLKEELAKKRRFELEYRVAYERYVAGDHKVVFPAGTYLMRVRFKVQCVAPP